MSLPVNDSDDETGGSWPRRLFDRITTGSLANLADTLRDENSSAILLAAGTAIALVWANSPWAASYHDLGAFTVGPGFLHLDLTLAEWAKDGLLTIFFFVVGLELKRELVVGQLRRFSTAIVPVIAAVGGMAIPALLYSLVNVVAPNGDLGGWAVPVATDIAFAVAILTLFGKRLPPALRAFLLTLAVADDLLGIIVIAVFYAHGLSFLWLLGAAAAIAAFAVLARLRRPPAVLMVVIAVLAWYAMHQSGVHATIAGAALGFTVPAVVLARQQGPESLAERYEHRWHPVSAGLAVPLFAFFAAGVPLSPSDLGHAAVDPVAQGVFLGLVIGKPLGIMAATWLLVRFTHASLDDAVSWRDLLAVAFTAGIGFTVSLLIGELAYPPDSGHEEALKAAILLGSLASAALGALLLVWRTRRRLNGDASPSADPANA